MNDAQRYPAQVFYSDEDEGFIAIATDLPGCSAFGDTQEEAVAQLRNAIVAWQMAAEKAGNPIPEPSKPQVDDLPSGKILLRLPRTLHAQLIDRAKYENVSLNQHLVFVLTASVTASAYVRNTAISEVVRANCLFAGNVHFVAPSVGYFNRVLIYGSSRVDASALMQPIPKAYLASRSMSGREIENG